MSSGGNGRRDVFNAPIYPTCLQIFPQHQNVSIMKTGRIGQIGSVTHTGRVVGGILTMRANMLEV
jgi:hypothetical protein